ncbi:4'-phosphopantetheinyl transferase family protein [Spirosoma oryzicola]|uniref:4'-phosphopantetheinyl transferase family protein n=1 Tax=Spirosoma oryzicola TaxID=2898794 RepID=UPI001E58BF63|nr:4'-phosphopantetheinyl transferase superfamily protein [Spirosoma oryzicola]UHG91358.1 4'-phosphopantetheinyl transferase superfamily protein [Spirosoma oryzicola]
MKATTVWCNTLQTVDWSGWAVCSFCDEVAVFRLFLPADLQVNPYLLTLLQPDEWERAERFRRISDRNRFVYGRALTKIVIGKLVDRKPATIRLVTGINKKPLIASFSAVHFNVSHAGDWIMLAVSKAEVGVDLEKEEDNFTFQDILSTSFSAEEQAFIGGSNNPKKEFYRLWTRKEALVKATAKGIDDDFYRIPSLDGEHQSSVDLPGKDGFWTVTSFRVDDDHQAAVAYQPSAGSPKFYTVDSNLFLQN